MITLCFFARYRERLGVTQEQLAVDTPLTVSQLLEHLAGRGGAWREIFECPRGVMVAINQEMASSESRIDDGAEVAVFPPVTGG